MKIDMGNFGNRTAALPGSPGNTPRVSAEAFGAGVGVAAQRVGDTVMNLAAQRMDQEERERQRQEALAARNVASRAKAAFQADLLNVGDELMDGLKRKQIPRDQVEAQFGERVRELKETHAAAVSPDYRGDFDEMEALLGGRLRRGLKDAVYADIKDERTAAFRGTLEEISRVGQKNPQAAIKQVEGMRPEAEELFGRDGAEKLFQNFREGVSYSHHTDALLKAKTSVKALASVQKAIEADPNLDPEKKTILVGRAMSFAETLQARAAREEQSRLNRVEASIKTLDSMILKGFEPSADQLAAVASQARGTPYEAAVKAQVQFANASAQFRAMNPREQETYLTKLEAQVREHPSPQSINAFERFKTLAEQQQKAAREDPISWAGQKGLADVAPLNFADLGSLSNALAERVDVARGMAKQYGAPPQVLTQQEAATLTEYLRKAPTEQKATILKALKSGIQDQSAYVATMGQIAPEAPTVAWAGALMGKRNAGQAGELILRGEAVLNPQGKEGKGGAFKLPPEKDLRTGFNDLVGAAYARRPDAYGVAFQAAQRAYAALAAEESDYSGEYDDARWQKAVEMATGGAAEYNGGKVIKPYGMDEDRFKDQVAQAVGKLVESKAVSLDKSALRRMQLENVGDGRYLMKNGSGYVLDRRGAPAVIDLNMFDVEQRGFIDSAGREVVEQIPR